MAIARAVLEYCADPKRLGCKTLFATHYHELTVLEGEIPGVKNYNIAALECGDFSFATACLLANRKYGKNTQHGDIKSHQYIILSLIHISPYQYVIWQPISAGFVGRV